MLIRYQARSTGYLIDIDHRVFAIWELDVFYHFIIHVHNDIIILFPGVYTLLYKTHMKWHELELYGVQ